MNVDAGKVPCAPLGRGDMELSYQGESFEGFTLRFHRCPRWGRGIIPITRDAAELNLLQSDRIGYRKR